MVREMSAKGINPGYIHGRIELPPDQWISPIWFESFGATLNQARSSNTYLGYCDEYWWPSGRANGKVLEKNPHLRAASLNWHCLYGKNGKQIKIPKSLFAVAAEIADSDQSEKDIIRGSSLKIIGGGSEFLWTVPKSSWKIYVFKSYFHSGYDGGNVIYLDRRLASEFIRIAHKPYLKFEEEFGKRIAGVLVDHEGDYGWNYLIEKRELHSDEFYLNHRPKDYVSKSGMVGPVIISEY
jgi:hypothetical protein